MDSSGSRQCIIPIVILMDAAKSTRGDFRRMVDHNVERLVGELEGSEFARHVRLMTVHYHDDVTVKSKFVSLRDIRPGDLELNDCRGSAKTGKAMLFALDEMQKQRRAWKDKDISYTRAIFLLMTDDRPVDWPGDEIAEMDADYQKAALRVRALEAEGQHVIAGCALSQLRQIRCNEKLLEQMCRKVFQVRQMPDGVDHMEKGFSDVIGWVKKAISEAWEDRPRAEEKNNSADKRPEWKKEEPVPKAGPAPDDPLRRFMGILDEGNKE